MRTVKEGDCSKDDCGEIMDLAFIMKWNYQLESQKILEGKTGKD